MEKRRQRNRERAAIGRCRGLGLAAALLLVSGAPARAQELTLAFRGASLAEIAVQLERQTGYEFVVAAGRELQSARRDYTCRNRPLAAVLSDLQALFRCDFLSTKSEGFFVTEPPKREGPETSLGPYRLRVGRLAESLPSGTLLFPLEITAPDELQMEAIAGFRGDLRILDNFRRSLLPSHGTELWSTVAPRVRLTEYVHRFALSLPDARASRIHRVDGALLLYRRVTPVRIEFPLDGTDHPQTVTREGVEVQIERAFPMGRDFAVSTQLAWPEGRVVVGRGISRTPIPYLVDERGRVYRDVAPNLAQVRRPGTALRAQRFRFEGLEARPVRLVYDLFVKEAPEIALPFRLSGIPLPENPARDAWRKRQPFFAEEGGALLLRVLDRNGRGLEGVLAVGLSRKTGNGWTGWRWSERATEPDGSLRIDHIQPGTYRLLRVFRLEPGAAPVDAPPGAAREPVEVTVVAGKERAAPPLRVPVQRPEE